MSSDADFKRLFQRLVVLVRNSALIILAYLIWGFNKGILLKFNFKLS
jgi:hypothetical protein